MEKPEIVVITGASAGVGRATVREFARHGARIGLIARGHEGLAAAVREVEELGGQALPVVCDVAEPEQLEHAADEIERKLGPIDIWINNAMTTVFGRVMDIPPEEYRRVTDVTYHGMLFGTQAALRRMKPRNRGVIVQVGSALAFRAIPLQAAYCGAKHACRALTNSLRTELMHDAVAVHLTMVHLPGMNTPQFDWCKSYMPRKAQPVAPIYQPEVAARAIYWAAHHRRRDIYVGASTIMSVLGNKLFPGVGDYYLARRGIKGQLTQEREDPERPANLFAPVAGDFGAHGRFDDKATERYAVTRAAAFAGQGGTRGAAALLAFGAVALASWGMAKRRACRRWQPRWATLRDFTATRAARH